jgi:hypothetical protein
MACWVREQIVNDAPQTPFQESAATSSSDDDAHATPAPQVPLPDVGTACGGIHAAAHGLPHIGGSTSGNVGAAHNSPHIDGSTDDNVGAAHNSPQTSGSTGSGNVGVTNNSARIGGSTDANAAATSNSARIGGSTGDRINIPAQAPDPSATHARSVLVEQHVETGAPSNQVSACTQAHYVFALAISMEGTLHDT